MPEPISQRGDGILIRLHVQPRASRTEIVGLHGDALKLRVAAPPVAGEANQEIIRFLARTLGISTSKVELASGSGGRRKVITIAGVSLDHARRTLLP